MEESERGLSITSLALLFLLGVVVCAVFFSLGFLLGYKERSSSNTTAVERVTLSGGAPPAVNPPPQKEETSLRHDATLVPAGATAQPPAARLGQKGENVASSAKASAGDASSGAALPAPQGAAGPGNRDSSETPGPVPTKRPATGGIVLQVAALQTVDDAERLVEVLKERGYPVFLVTPKDAQANDNLFRVRVGPFQLRAEEEKTRRKLEAEGFKPFVKR